VVSSDLFNDAFLTAHAI